MNKTLRHLSLCLMASAMSHTCMAWGFYAHKQINHYAVFLLPPEMMRFYKPNIDFITEHAVDPDMRRYAVADEAPKHYIDMDNYGTYPYAALPHQWDSAVAKYTEDTLLSNGIVPWWVPTMLQRLTYAFKQKDQARILKLSAEIGHYIADAHVPLHASSNHDGQHTDQKGIHGFWESRLPELFAEKQYDFFIGKADHISDPSRFMWARVLESGAASDTVLKFEARLNASFPSDRKFSFEERNGKVIRQYSTDYSSRYQDMLSGMVERRMRQSIYAVASFWYTAWVNAGQPDLSSFSIQQLSAEDQKAMEELELKWKSGKPLGRICD